jgi:hypothetical protein
VSVGPAPADPARPIRVLSPEHRAALRVLRQAIDDARLAAHGQVRVYRNVLIVATLIITGVVVAFPLVAAALADDLMVLRPLAAAAGQSATSTASPGSTASSGPAPSAAPASAGPGAPPAPTETASTVPPAAQSGSTSAAAVALESTSAGRHGTWAADWATIEVWGVFGGLIGALVSLRSLSASRRPIGLQVTQLALKLPAGAATAVFGILLLQANIVPPLKPVDIGRIAAYAVLFGFAQEAVTTLVDRQAARLLNQGKPISERTLET